MLFEELDYQSTPLGDISLRRRAEPKLDGEILYEVKLGDEYLMSSLFTEAEIQLSKLGLAALKQNGHDAELDIIVGGLGLGYTAAAALEDNAVKSLQVIDVMQAVISWHENGLVPLGETLTSDPRCNFHHADFFKVATSDNYGLYPDKPEKLAHAVLLDIDHSPKHFLNESNHSFYTEESLRKMTSKIHTGGIFALWSNDPIDPGFNKLLDRVFRVSEAHVITFPNPYTGEESSNSVYIAHNS